MKQVKLSFALLALVVSMPASAYAQNEARTISIMNHGKESVSFTFPQSSQVEIGADHEIVSPDETIIIFKGNVKVNATLATGEVVTIRADEVKVVGM